MGDKKIESFEGFTIERIKPGDNANFPKAGDKVTINYTGRLKSNKKKFDSSLDRNEPFECKIGIGQVIKGWDEGIPKLSLGEKAILDIKSNYGYGKSGFGSVIPANSDLLFEVELLGINDLKARK